VHAVQHSHFLFPRCVLSTFTRQNAVLRDLSKLDSEVDSLFPFQLPPRFILCAAMEHLFTPTRRLQDMWELDRTGLPSGPLLSQLLRESPSLQVLHFRVFDFMEEHCRALVTLQRTDLEVKFMYCAFEPQNAEDSFIEWLRSNQVVTELECCQMGSHILSALSGNNSVKKLTIYNNSSKFGEDEMHSLIQALPGNLGIEHLCLRCLSYFEFSDETWILFFRSLSTHPRIKLFSAYGAWIRNHRSLSTALSTASKTTVLNAIIQMLHLNTVIQRIDLPRGLSHEEVYRNSILPRLEMNRSFFEVQRQAVKRADLAIRPQLLGRALHVVRYNPNLVFHILLENVPLFVRMEEDPA
jgi:hypothetical protein